MAEPMRITPQEAREKVISGTALLVCAYEDEEKFKKLRLAGAISMTGLRKREPSLTKDNEIIFYCA